MHPILFQLGPLTAYSYGTLVFLGVVLGTLAGRAECRRLGIDPAHASDVALLGVAAGLPGGKLAYLVLTPREVLAQASLAELLTGGLVWYGVVAAAIPATVWYACRHRLPAWRLLDAAAVALALGHAVGRLGCWLAGCCHGRPTTLPWAATFLDPRSAAPLGVGLHPTQLYLAAHSLLVFGLLRWRSRRQRFDGELLLWSFLAYAPGRFVIEQLRGDEGRGAVGPLSSAQALSVAAFAIASALLVARRWRHRASLP